MMSDKKKLKKIMEFLKVYNESLRENARGDTYEDVMNARINTGSFIEKQIELILNDGWEWCELKKLLERVG